MLPALEIKRQMDDAASGLVLCYFGIAAVIMIVFAVAVWFIVSLFLNLDPTLRLGIAIAAVLFAAAVMLARLIRRMNESTPHEA